MQVFCRTSFNSLLRGIRYSFKHRMESTSYNHLIQRRTDNIIKSSEDNRLYRGFLLNNGMKVILISDKDTDKSAASLTINIGSLNDPAEFPGMAHFCEHMLFMGTKKYPDENEYGNFLALHGGYYNAYTAEDHTNYYFDVAPDKLTGAIDRFAEFFISPQFYADSSEREVMAVDSEYANAIQNDSSRITYLLQSVAQSDHPYSRFGWGNRKTLWDMSEVKDGRKLNPREELLKFYKQYYSANLMSLVVLGKESLNDLAATILPIFSQVPNQNLSRPRWEQHPYGREQLAKKVFAIPVKEIRTLRLTFATPDLLTQYKSKPDHYVSHLLGHEGKGGLLYALKARSWASELSAWQETVAHGFGLFRIQIDLSTDGLLHVDDVIKLVFAYINTVVKLPAEKWIFEELKMLSQIQFTYEDRKRPEEMVCSLSPILHDYPTEEVLFGPKFMLADFQPDLIRALVGYLTPENVLVSIAAKEFEGQTDQVEKWFQVPFKIIPIHKSLVDKFCSASNTAEFSLPKRNPFIPAQFELFSNLKPELSPMPEILVNYHQFRMWFKQDAQFRMPKLCTSLNILSPISYRTPADFVRTYLAVDILKDSLTDYAYDATVAGLDYLLDNDEYGIRLGVHGFHDKHDAFLLHILNKLIVFQPPDLQRFEVLKERYIRKLKSFDKKQPHKQVAHYMRLALSEKTWHIPELLTEAQKVTLNDVISHIVEFFEHCRTEVLIHGNSHSQVAKNTLQEIAGIFSRNKKSSESLSSNRLCRYRSIMLPDGSSSVLKIKNDFHSNSALSIFLQINLEEPRMNMLTELFEQIINDAFFDRLRTKEQLGYVTGSCVKCLNGVHWIQFFIQGSKSPPEMEARVEAYIKTLEKTFNNMPEAEFQEHIESLATLRLEKPKTIVAQNDKYWSEIVCQQYHFERDTSEVAILRKITKNEVVDFYKTFIAQSAPNRRKFSIHIYGSEQHISASKEPNNVRVLTVGDLASYKSSLPLYGYPQSYLNVPPFWRQEYQAKL